jgi:hypothetical protein
MRPTPDEIRQLEAKARAHDDYMAATKVMAQRQGQMAGPAARGDDFARGYLAALHEFSLAVLAELSRRVS